MKRLGILLSGRGSNFEAIADNVAAGNIDAEIAVVISNRPEARGLEVARQRGLPAICIPSKGLDRNIYDAMLAEELKKQAVDLVCLAGYMRLLSAGFIREFPGRVLNIHPSLLPSFPGSRCAAPGAGARRESHRLHGTLRGRIPGCRPHQSMQAAVPVLDDDTVETLSARILNEEHRIYSEAIRMVLGGRLRIEGRRVLGGLIPAEPSARLRARRPTNSANRHWRKFPALNCLCTSPLITPQRFIPARRRHAASL